jgi:glucuronosyltransferase
MYEIIPIIMGFESHFQAIKEKHGLNISLNLADTFNRAALKLVNSDFAIDYPAPVEPDTVLIGGFAVDEPAPPLSAELENFMESSGDHGVIVISFGTLTKRFDPIWTKTFVDALSRLPQKVIWRYYPSHEDLIPTLFNDTVKDKFRLMRWIPQSSLLAHPKTKLFISHCGLNGMFETTHYGVPVVALPLSGDQMQNAAKLTDHLNIGVSLDMFSVDSTQLYNAIVTVLTKPEYKINAEIVSQRVRDKPMDASSKLTYWVDYVIRHHGASHLKSTAHKLTWIQYHCLDVMCLIGSILFSVFFSIAFIALKLTSKLYAIVAQEILVSRHEKIKIL